VYDMYSWDQPAASTEHDEHAAAGGAARDVPRAGQAASADQVAYGVQLALDRRDNGGDSSPAQPV
jgi:hypothetical protein